MRRKGSSAICGCIFTPTEVSARSARFGLDCAAIHLAQYVRLTPLSYAPLLWPAPDRSVQRWWHLIRGRLKHLPGGHYEDFFMPAPLDTSGGKSEVQAVGTTNSFLRRYVTCNIFNIVVVGDDEDGTGGTIDETQTKTIVELIKRAKAGSKFLKYMKAQSIEEACSLAAAVATIAARDYRKAISTLEEQTTKAEAGRAHLS